MVPVRLRNALFAAFRRAVSRREPAAAYRREIAALRAETPDERAYLLDRIPRYKRALAATARAKIGPAAREASAAAVAVAMRLFDQGLYFDCHEILEDAWRAAGGAERVALQGLIQAGAGFHKLELGSQPGAAELLGKSAAKLRQAGRILGRDLRPLAASLERCAALAVLGKLTLGDAPRMGHSPP